MTKLCLIRGAQTGHDGSVTPGTDERDAAVAFHRGDLIERH